MCKELTYSEINGKSYCQTHINIKNLYGNSLLSFYDGQFKNVWLKFRKSFIICYENFFVLIQKCFLNDGQKRDEYMIFTYNGNKLEACYGKWNPTANIVKSYNILAKRKDDEQKRYY